MRRKIVSVFLALAMIAAIIPFSAVNVFAGTAEFHGASVDYGGADCIFNKNGDMILTYKTSGDNTLTVSADLTAEIFAVGGGGSGATAGTSAKAGGGNGGKVVLGTYKISAGSKLNITVGYGGDANTSTSSSGAAGRAGKATTVASSDAAFSAISASGGAGGSKGSSTPTAGTPAGGVVCEFNGNVYGIGGKLANTENVTAESGEANTGNGGQAGKTSSNKTYRFGGAGGSGIVIIRIFSHPHTFTYGVDTENGAFTAECGNSIACNLTEPLSLSLNEYGCFDEAELYEWRANGASEPTISYYKADDLENPLTAAISEPGNYVAVACVGSGENAVSVQKEFTVQQHIHGTGEAAAEFSLWYDAASLPKLAGNYVLCSNVELSSSWAVPQGDVNLCLNGHVIELGGNQITVGSESNLNIYDCKQTEHYFSGVNNGLKCWKYQPAKNGNTVHTVKGGVITGGAQISSFANQKGGALYINGGNCSLYGGNIAGNYCSSSKNAYGGGVFVESGTFTMYGGGIYGNGCFAEGTNQGSGGGVFIVETSSGLNGEAFVYGGEIKYNTTSMYAGGVYAVGGPLTVGGTAVIRDNTAAYAEYVAAGDKECNVQTGSNTDGFIRIGTGDSAPADGMSIGVRRQTITNPICENVDDYSEFFSSDNNGLYIIYDSATRQIRLGDKSADGTYSINIDVAGEGIVYSDPQAAAAETLVTLTVAPANGWVFSTLTVTAADSTVVPAAQNGNTITFTMPTQDVTVAAEFAENHSVYGKVVSIGGSELDTTVQLLDISRQTVIKTLAAPGETVPYRLSDIEAGSYVLAASKPGYTSRYYSVQVAADGIVIKDAVLYEAGDSNGDGVYLADDYSFAVNLALSAENTVPADTEPDDNYKIAVADVDGDGYIDVLDCALVERAVNVN